MVSTSIFSYMSIYFKNGESLANKEVTLKTEITQLFLQNIS